MRSPLNKNCDAFIIRIFHNSSIIHKINFIKERIATMKKEIRRAAYFRANVMLLAIGGFIVMMIRKYTKKVK